MKYGLWLSRLYSDEFIRLRRWLGTLITIFLAIYIVVIFLFTIRLMGLPFLRLSSISNIDDMTRFEIVEYVRIVFGYGIAEWFVTVFSIALLFLWMAFAYTVWIGGGFMVEMAWQRFYPSDRAFYLMYCRYTKFMCRVAARSIPFIVPVGFILGAAILIKQRIWLLTPQKVGVVIGSAFLLLVPYVYSVVWYMFLRIVRSHPKAYYLDQYLFSQHAARRRLKKVVDLLLFLALLTWVLLPGYFRTCRIISDKAAFGAREILDYKGTWTSLAERVTYDSPGNERWMIPAPDDTYDKLDFAGTVRRALPLAEGFPTLQRYLFALVTFCTLLELAIPAFYNAARTRGYRLVFKRAIVATVKVTVLLVALQVFIRKTYFIDMSETIGLGAMFAFIFSIAIAQDKAFYKKWKRRRRSN